MKKSIKVFLLILVLVVFCYKINYFVRLHSFLKLNSLKKEGLNKDFQWTIEQYSYTSGYNYVYIIVKNEKNCNIKEYEINETNERSDEFNVVIPKDHEFVISFGCSSGVSYEWNMINKVDKNLHFLKEEHREVTKVPEAKKKPHERLLCESLRRHNFYFKTNHQGKEGIKFQYKHKCFDEKCLYEEFMPENYKPVLVAINITIE